LGILQQAKRIKVNGPLKGLTEESNTDIAFSCVYNNLGAAVRCSLISTAGTAHFVAYATIFEVAFQIQ
jgi:hypothetical protein